VEPSVTDQASGSIHSDPRTAAVATAEQLVAARERLGLGKGEVAQRLKLHPRQLDAIERGDWAALPGRAFARGCVRSYGRLLGADVEPLLEAIGSVSESEGLRASASLAAPLPRGGGFGFDGEGSRSKLPWAVLGVIGVIAVGLFFGRDGDVSKVSSWIGGDKAPQGAAAPAGKPGDAGTPAAGGALPPGSAVVPPPLLLPAPGSAAAPGASVPAASAGTAPAAASATPAAPGVPAAGASVPGPAAKPQQAASAAAPPIRLTVRQDAWVDVRQADGKSVFMGTVKPGAPLDVSGTAPFALTIGNANQVTLEFEGKPVEFKPMPSNIAKVKLP
jgi:cytoskeleton protein RodZ